MNKNDTCIQQLFNSRNSRKWLEADTHARELESKDGQDRIVLLADEEYSILTLNDCYATFSHYEDELAEEIHIEEAFYNAQDGLPLYAFFDLVLSVKGGCSDYFTRSYTMLMSKNFIMEEASEIMDDEISMMLRQKLPPCSDLLFLTHYLKEHWEKFGTPFVWD
ncbi:hypothetical protein [Sphaerochaeta globosa]|uniref:AcrIC5-like domain-containing protein n=1 Tax=Sphaerochaeta globosa (strain ATCC BAA-1886 / DSM 22777 / Buddy) TaxID=158189 RepID=F0RWL6_SPHGB|nr:hypothetical protein [Sphaerochaeta globosa]ADY13647.1 hypothetical protein SpiBuddy_1823 [Sphaerochaeta globosa str. Buddy]